MKDNPCSTKTKITTVNPMPRAERFNIFDNPNMGNRLSGI
jgi:hypothetical protein